MHTTTAETAEMRYAGQQRQPRPRKDDSDRTYHESPHSRQHEVTKAIGEPKEHEIVKEKKKKEKGRSSGHKEATRAFNPPPGEVTRPSRHALWRHVISRGYPMSASAHRPCAIVHFLLSLLFSFFSYGPFRKSRVTVTPPPRSSGRLFRSESPKPSRNYCP